MADMQKTKPDKLADMKNAASLLLKGGCLISEPCSKCRGVQIRFKENIMCINCGNEQKNASQTVSSSTSPKQESVAIDKKAEFIQTGLEPAGYILQEKVLILSGEIKDEQDIALQKQKADLIEIYLRILEKIRELL